MYRLKLTASALTLAFLLAAAPAAAQSQSDHNIETARQLDIFNSVYRDLDLYYVDTLNPKKNIENALLYMLDQLDPYTEYYGSDRSEELKQLTTGKYAGIGAIISTRLDLGRCIISNPYPGMPAAEAGLRRGDIILAIDGKDVGTIASNADADAAGDYSASVSQKLRGEPGSTFSLRVRRPGTEKELTFSITRAAVTLPSITTTTLLNDTVGYILLNRYTENTARDVRLALIDLKQRGARRLVLDLRGNPGGLMGEAIKLVNLFIPRGKEVVSTRGKVREDAHSFKTSSDALDLSIPIAVLVNYSTASSAEITSGALQDYDRAIVVGQRTYGKGLVQETRDAPSGGVFKLTTSKYYIPSGRCIQAYKFEDGEPVHLPDSLCHEFHTAAGRTVLDGGGITPDLLVEPDSLPDLLYYLQLSNALFDYTVLYRNSHPSIASPEEFYITDEDYADFRRYLKEKNFTYDRRSLRFLEELKKMARREGYAESAAAEFAALEAKLSRNDDFDFTHWEKEIRALVEHNIVQAYYYDEGAARYDLRLDKTLDAALPVLCSDDAYRRLLSVPTEK